MVTSGPAAATRTRTRFAVGGVPDSVAVNALGARPWQVLARPATYDQAGTDGNPDSAIASSASSYCWSTSLPAK